MRPHPSRHTRRNAFLTTLQPLEPRRFLDAADAPTLFFSTSTDAAPFGTQVTLVARVLSTTSTDGMAIQFVDHQSTGDLLLGSVTLQNNTASFTWCPPTVGDHQLVAQCAGTPNSTPAVSEPLALTVTPAATQTSLVSLSSGSVVAHVDAAGTVANGSVTFAEGTRIVATIPLSPDGTATLPALALRKGSHTLVAAFNGSPTASTSTSQPLPIHFHPPAHPLNSRHAAVARLA